jgi:hypothetical protein
MLRGMPGFDGSPQPPPTAARYGIGSVILQYKRESVRTWAETTRFSDLEPEHNLEATRDVFFFGKPGCPDGLPARGREPQTSAENLQLQLLWSSLSCRLRLDGCILRSGQRN